MSETEQTFWHTRWEKSETGWDIGDISTPLREYFDQLTDKNLRILIPGCGNSYEGEYLWKKGFRNVVLTDLSPIPLANFAHRNPDFPKDQLICSDFFALEQTFDLIVEQTFFCAIPPTMRDDYAEKMHSLLSPGGHLAGLYFNFPLTHEGPPYGGSEEEYRKRFSARFEIEKMHAAPNSIKPRAGRELWVEMRKK